MDILEIKNGVSTDKNKIPILSFADFELNVCDDNRRVITMFVDNSILYAVLFDDETSKIFVCSTFIGTSYPSLTLKKSYLHMFERELYEDYGIEPVGHPFLKPVRKQDNYDFLKSDDFQSHEVAVGPVHAGIIEPGHFRFLCNGERVNHLEIMLGYQHRGVEDLMLKSHCVQLAESICGDSTIAYSKTYAEIIEGLSLISVDKKSEIIRKIALEMERIAIHIGDLCAIAGDVAYQIGANVFAVTRTLVINTLLDICGNRFGKGLIKIGGVNYDITDELVQKISIMLDEVENRIKIMADAMFSNSAVVSRLENTGVVSKKKAKEIGMTGLAARASGQNTDSRKIDNPEFTPVVLKTGDVLARTNIRYLETLNSIRMIKNYLSELEGEINKENHKISLAPNKFITAINEGWRGEVIHTCITDEKGQIKKYKIKDPSFNNWFGLALAVRNNQISDFPVCNKSFNLSYCGFDL